MKTSSMRGFLAKKSAVLFFFICVLSAVSLAEGTISSPFMPESRSPVTSTGYNPEASFLGSGLSGSTYSPFSPISGEKNPLFDNPVLYGPGGEPIGGLPVSDGCVFLFLAAASYAIAKLVRKIYFSKYPK